MALDFKLIGNPKVADDGLPVTADNRYGAGSGTVDTVVAGTGISVDSSDPANPIVTATTTAVVESVTAGTGISVDNSDPANPIVSATAATTELLGALQYGAVGGSFYTLANPSTLTVLDGTNLSLSFTIPASGAVIAVMSGFISTTATDNSYSYLGILAHGTSTQKGKLQIVNYASAAAKYPFTIRQKITGLTPGAAVWDVAGVSQNANTTIPTDSNPTVGSTGSPFVFEIWSA